MRAFQTALVAALSSVAVSAAGLVACSAEPPNGDAEGASEGSGGSIGLRLKLSSGVSLDSVSFTITGPGGYAKTGNLDVSRSATISGIVGGLPAGAGYSITLAATSTDHAMRCNGQASFAVTVGATTPVRVNLDCREDAATGSVAVNGVINVCPVLDGIDANPAEAVIGNGIALRAIAHDADAGPAALSYQWTAPSGAFDEPHAPNPSFGCSAPGTVTLTVSVSDGDATSGCGDSATLDVECSLPGTGSVNDVLTVAVYGDAPYGTTPTDESQTLATPAFIATMNADPKVSLVMHVGDIHSGKQYCTEAYNTTVSNLWHGFIDPLVYTPGDNEWTDCHKAAEGGGTYDATTGRIDYVLDASGNPVDYAKGEPLANLASVRSLFFPRAGMTLGGGGKQVLSQAQYFDPAHPADAAFVENVMWLDSQVLFVTVNVPGGSNNDNDVWYGAPAMSAPQAQEIADRTDADLRWLDAAFAQASAHHAAGVVIAWQADVWDPEKGAAHQTAYEPLVQSVATHTTAFGKPVLMLNGDSHVYKSGNPLSPGDATYAMHPGYEVPNFHRVVVHGSTTPLEWLRLTVDPNGNAPHGTEAFGPFAWERVVF